MRRALAAVVVVVVAGAGAAGDGPEVTGTVDGKRITFPEKSVPDGVKATLGLLESCHDEGLYQADELRKAARGDHVRLEFPRPVPVAVMGKEIEVSELVFRRPLNTGVFWVRTGDGWRRYAKYEFQKEEPFAAWLRQARAAD